MLILFDFEPGKSALVDVLQGQFDGLVKINYALCSRVCLLSQRTRVTRKQNSRYQRGCLVMAYSPASKWIPVVARAAERSSMALSAERP